MAWFRHEDNARNDVKLKALVDEFGPAGELVWWRMLEVRNQLDTDIIATTDELALELALRPSWKFPLDKWLQRASKLGLIKMRRSRNYRRSIEILKWSEHQPEWATKKGTRERKRRSRARRSQDGHSDPSHSDEGVTVTDYRQTTGLGLDLGETSEQQQHDAAVDASLEPQNLIDRCVEVGVSRDVAAELVDEHPRRVALQLTWLSLRKPDNPAAVLVSAVRNDWSKPKANGSGSPYRNYPDFTGSGRTA